MVNRWGTDRPRGSNGKSSQQASEVPPDRFKAAEAADMVAQIRDRLARDDDAVARTRHRAAKTRDDEAVRREHVATRTRSDAGSRLLGTQQPKNVKRLPETVRLRSRIVAAPRPDREAARKDRDAPPMTEMPRPLPSPATTRSTHG